MLISSKFKDYYDSVLSYGIDKTVVYDRTTREIDVSVKHYDKVTSALPVLPSFTNLTVRGIDVQATFFVIGFCGKVYPMVRLAESRLLNGRNADFFCFDSETLRKHVGKAKSQWNYFSGKSFSIGQDVEMEGFFNPDTWSHLLPAFRKYSVPAFALKTEGHFTTKLVLNPCLKNLGFMKVKDTAAAFQDLYQFISGYLGTPAMKIVKISDVAMAAKKGHNGKYSFRRPPTKKS